MAWTPEKVGKWIDDDGNWAGNSFVKAKIDGKRVLSLTNADLMAEPIGMDARDCKDFFADTYPALKAAVIASGAPTADVSPPVGLVTEHATLEFGNKLADLILQQQDRTHVEKLYNSDAPGVDKSAALWAAFYSISTNYSTKINKAAAYDWILSKKPIITANTKIPSITSGILFGYAQPQERLALVTKLAQCQGFDVNYREHEKGNSMFMSMALAKDDLSNVFAYLCTIPGAQPNAPAKSGNTPLEAAMQFNKPKIVEILKNWQNKNAASGTSSSSAAPSSGKTVTVDAKEFEIMKKLLSVVAEELKVSSSNSKTRSDISELLSQWKNL